ncbi:phospholipase A2 inhibitor gamma subunit B [Alligator mississippiensis]|uniref:phospholipase A2 inhibitor gamma subunit B n=1 Tax=Alligator mississippiensis TaxID=8496 RepID=UPI002877B8A7|nr:phospholipase A2 inhibitor gamma subunit B [Alligator mississippiensis]
MMKAPSILLVLLVALLASGSGLECEVCFGSGTSCTGTAVTCPDAANQCSNIMTQFNWANIKMLSISRGCMPWWKCGYGPAQVKMSDSLEVMTSISCCPEDDCMPTVPTFEPTDNTPNGRYCPSCFALYSAQCGDDEVDCTGSEDQCMDMLGIMNSSSGTSLLTMKGCATEFACQILDASRSSLAGIGIYINQLKCVPASGATIVAPGPARLLFPALAGLLLAKLLS